MDDDRQLGTDEALDGLSVAPEPDEADRRATQPVRDAIDATDVGALRRDPADEGAKLDVALDETFPTSDPPSNTQPGKGKDPAPSSGYDPEAEEEAARH